MIKRFLKIFILLLLCIFVFRTFTGNNYISSLSFLEYLQNCPDTLSVLSEDLKIFFNYTPDPNGFVTMLGLSNFLEFISKIIGVIGYVGSCFIHLITLLVYIISFVFI